MATSQNGWSANDRSMVASYTLPGGKIALRKGDVSVILLWVANRFHDTVEPLVWPGNWGYAERPIRGSSTTLSNHASGTAIDLNAPRHPLGRSGTFTATQVRAIRALLAYCEGVVRWGGDYSGRKDEMHFEVNAGAAAVHRVANKIRAGNGATTVEDDDLPTPADVWDYKIADPFVPPTDPAYLKPARDLVGWAATHAAYARGNAQEAIKAVAELQKRVDQLTVAPGGGATVAAAGRLSDDDVQRIAAAVIDLLSQRTAS